MPGVPLRRDPWVQEPEQEVADYRPDPAWSETVQSLYSRLIRVDIPKDLSVQLIKEVLSQLPKEDWNNKAKLWNQLTAVTAGRLKTSEPWEFDGTPRIVALIGPTGGGENNHHCQTGRQFLFGGGPQGWLDHR